MSESSDKIRCVVVDDAALMRATIRQLLESDPQIEVTHTAGSGPVALDKIREQNPDVVTMDVEMPGMDGISLLREVMSDCPVPVIMVSGHTHAGAQKTLDAMEAGAVDYVAKPTGGKGANLRDIAPVLIAKVKQAAGTNMAALWRMAASPQGKPPPARLEPTAAAFDFDPKHVVAIGISCGGPASLVDIFPSIPEHMPAILITQHMPEGFTQRFAERLDRLSRIDVREAKQGDVVIPNQALVAPGHSHMTIKRRGAKAVVELDQGPNVCGHRPSVDKLFRSVADACKDNCTAVIMTGMGNDGAQAIGEIQSRGGLTIAQDAETSVVYGMPKAATELGHIDRVLPLGKIVPTLVESLSVSV